MTDWTTVVDISEHQGVADFQILKSTGVDGIILRVCHGMTLDKRFGNYYALARSVGYRQTDLAYYEFCNPKRGSGRACADFFLDAVFAATRTLSVGLMLDIESYANETPNKGTYLTPAAYTAWLLEHIARLKTEAPEARVFGYTNHSYYDNTQQGVCSRLIAAQLEWIGARYPVNSPAGYAKSPVPSDPSRWDEWAFGKASGPVMPNGANGWAAWQFSAGFNNMGSVYGFQSADLDLNIVRPEAWARWTKTPAPTPPVPQEDDDMPTYAKTKEDRPGLPAGSALIQDDGTGRFRALDPGEFNARAQPQSTWELTNDQLDNFYGWSEHGPVVEHEDSGGAAAPSRYVGNLASIPGQVILTAE